MLSGAFGFMSKLSCCDSPPDRKIKMHDGEVVEDKPIKKADIVTLGEVVKPKRMSFLSLLRFSVRNLLATPKKLLFLMITKIHVELWQ